MKILEIRSLEKTKLEGTALKCSISCLLYYFINLIFTYLIKYLSLKVPNVIDTILQITFAIISIPLGYGITSNIIKISDSKTDSVTKFLDDFVLNFGKYLKLILHEIIRLIIPIILCSISILNLLGTFTAYVNKKNFLCFSKDLLPLAIILFVIALIVLIYFLLNYAIIQFIYFNSDKKHDSKNILDTSKEKMKGHKFDYIRLLLLFIPYFIFVAIILAISGKFLTYEYMMPLIIVLYTIIKPHITISVLLFTEELGDIKK